MLEFDVALFIEVARELRRIQHPRKDFFRVSAPQDPTQDGFRAVPPILALAVGKVVLRVVVVPPSLVSLLKLRPGARVGECMVG